MPNMKNLVASLIALLGQYAVLASPGGAPICPVGVAAPGVASSPHAGGTELTLAGGSFTLELDGSAVVPGTPATITAESSVMVTFNTTGDAFRGFLVIAESDTLITTDIFSLVEGDTDLQISGSCTTAGIGGMTHTDRGDKTSVSFMMQVPEAGEIQLDVNAYAGFVNATGNYYYDQVVIMVEADPAPETPAPETPAPAPETPAPTSGAPTLVTTILAVASAVMGWVVMS